MRALLNPKWLFVANTLPIFVLFFLSFGQYHIIKTLLDDTHVALWQSFGLALGVLSGANLAYAIYAIFKKKSLSAHYGFVALFGYVAFMYQYGAYFKEFIPSSVPQWMIIGNPTMYVFTFIMPTLVHALFVLVLHFTSEDKPHKAWISFLIAISIPVTVYFGSQIVVPLFSVATGIYWLHATLVVVIVITLTVLFLFIRGVFILVTQKAAFWQKYQLFWKIPLAIVLPVFGLLLNNGLFLYGYKGVGIESVGIFGDFNNIWFYILAIVNGLLVCLPNRDHKTYRLFLFIGRSSTFAYTLYFFLVFLPFLPLSVIGIIVFASGLMSLVPLLLFVVHFTLIAKDFHYLKSWFATQSLMGLFLLGFLFIPSCLTASYLMHKSVLKETLSYLYSPDYAKKYAIDKTSLRNTLNHIEAHNDRKGDFSFMRQIPFLSAYFNWVVLDNLTLSDRKKQYIENLFWGEPYLQTNQETIQNQPTKISKITTTSTYDSSQKSWKSWVELEITNTSDFTWNQEYATVVALPEGCWISDYYLYVQNKKEYGILAEKKAAMWLFSNIRADSQDPGFLHYLTGNKVMLRVFPFASKETRKTGIEFLHSEPIQLTIDNHVVQLGNAEKPVSQKIETDNVVYVSAQQKQRLKAIRRQPYFHFLVDVSKDKGSQTGDYIKRIELLLANHKTMAKNSKISFVNTYVNTFAFDNNWKQLFKAQKFEGGFFLERAINTSFFEAYKRKSKSYPVMVVVTDQFDNAVLEKDFADFKFAFPESNLFFNLNKQGVLEAHSLIDSPQQALVDSIRYSFDQSVFEYPLDDHSSTYLANNGQGSVVLKRDLFEVNEREIKGKDLTTALTLQAQWVSQTVHPETSTEKWLNLIKNSFSSKIMTPLTAYLVVENEAQKAILKHKQQQILSGNKSLDVDDEARAMSEPSIWVLAILLGLFIGYRQYRKSPIIPVNLLRIWGLWGLVYFLLIPSGVWGQGSTRSVAKPAAPAGTKRRLALVVGNKDYTRPEARLQNPLNDANDITATLNKLGFEVIKRTNLDRSSLETAIDDFASRLQGYDVGLFYFSGHGMAVQGENYLLPTDANLTYETQARSQCVSLRRVLDGMEGANAKVSLVLLDACRNNPFKRSWSRSTAPNGFVIPNNPRGSMVAFATREGSTADDNVGERNGLFTAELLKHLPSPNLGLRGILDRTIEGVERRSGGRQVPGRYDELRGDFVFLASQPTPQGNVVVTPPSPTPTRLVSGTTKDLPYGPRMVYVEGGTFEMGSSEGDTDEKPVHSVTLSDFWMAQTEVTVGQYLEFCTATNSHWPEWLEKGNGYHVETGKDKFYADKGYHRQATNLPIVGVSWHDAVAYADWLTQKTGFRYGLPTEAQWEYAARGGRLSKGHTYSGSSNIGEVAWTKENANSRPQTVGQKAKNELGLYDLSGNVWEWCYDWKYPYASTAQTNPAGPATGTGRVLRGGAWSYAPSNARVAYRDSYAPDGRYSYYGFRLVSQF